MDHTDDQPVEPQATLTNLFCPKCGQSDRLRSLKSRHYSRGSLCNGVPVEVKYVRAPVAATPPMCSVHAALERSDKLVLEVGNDCVACSLHERTALLGLLEPFADDDGSQDSLTVLRNLIASAAPAVAATVNDGPQEDALALKKLSGRIGDVIEESLRSYHCQYTRELPDLENGLALVDLLTPAPDKDVTRGLQELELLADYVAADVDEVIKEFAATPSITAPVGTGDDSFRDLLPLSPVRAAPGEYKVKARDGCVLWHMEGASFADWVCASINGYDAAIDALKTADSGDAEIARRLRDVLLSAFITGHMHGPSADYQVQIKFRSLEESQQCQTLIEALAHPEYRDSFIKQGVMEPFATTSTTPVDGERDGVRLAEAVMEVMGNPGISPQTWDRLVEVCAAATPPPAVTQHYFVPTETPDKCGIEGCGLNVLDHPEIPKHNFAVTEAGEQERVCYWCKHVDHGQDVCPVPYLARGEGGLVGSYPCGCTQSTVLSDSEPATPSTSEVIRQAAEAVAEAFSADGMLLTPSGENADFWVPTIESILSRHFAAAEPLLTEGNRERAIQTLRESRNTVPTSPTDNEDDYGSQFGVVYPTDEYAAAVDDDED